MTLSKAKSTGTCSASSREERRERASAVQEGLQAAKWKPSMTRLVTEGKVERKEWRRVRWLCVSREGTER
jgi:hypothetical protein